jgi:hypothetical protein
MPTCSMACTMRESQAQFTLGLQGVLPGDIFLDVLHIFEQFFLFGVKDFLAALPAFLSLGQVMAVVAAV